MRRAQLFLFLLLAAFMVSVCSIASANFILVDESISAQAQTQPPSGPAAEPAPSPSAAFDGTYWTLPHGSTDDAAIWEAMMQPITVYDGGLDQRAHVYLMENPDGTGAKLAQIHAQSQGIQVIGEVNEYGYVLAQAYSNYDDEYYPETDAELSDAFTLKTGYIKASGLKQIQVQQDYALLIDKRAQRMYIYINGKRVTELLVSTGLIQDGKTYRETPAGEYITVSRVGPFSTHKYMQSQMAIRINGGILIHEVPYEPLADGSRRYTNFEALLGQKASAGCIRVQRLLNEDGYNHKWIWDNFKAGKFYRVFVWDDAR